MKNYQRVLLLVVTFLFCFCNAWQMTFLSEARVCVFDFIALYLSIGTYIFCTHIEAEVNKRYTYAVDSIDFAILHKHIFFWHFWWKMWSDKTHLIFPHKDIFYVTFYYSNLEYYNKKKLILKSTWIYSQIHYE